MKYYLHNGKTQINAIGTQTYGRLIRALEKDGYQTAAAVLRRMRHHALKEQPYQCNAAETAAIRTARGATPWVRDVLTFEWLGDGEHTRLTLSRWPFQPPVKPKRRAAGHVTCPHCMEDFVLG